MVTRGGAAGFGPPPEAARASATGVALHIGLLDQPVAPEAGDRAVDGALAGVDEAASALADPGPQLGSGLGSDEQSDGDAAVMTMMHALGECMYGVTPGVPRAISNDRGVMIFCMR